MSFLVVLEGCFEYDWFSCVFLSRAQFAAYEQAKQRLQSYRGSAPLNSAQIFAIAAYSKAFATVATYPLQVVQTRMRNGNKSLSIVLLTLVEGGVWGWWRGLQTKLLQVVLMSAFQFTAYERMVKSILGVMLSMAGRPPSAVAH